MKVLDEIGRDRLIAKLRGDAGKANEQTYIFALHLHQELSNIEFDKSYDKNGNKITQTSILETLAQEPNMPSNNAGALRQMKVAGEFIQQAYNGQIDEIVKVGYWTVFHNVARSRLVQDDDIENRKAKKDIISRVIKGELPPGKVKTEIKKIKLAYDPGTLFGLVQLYNQWSFSSPDPRFGEDWPGRIPGQVVLNIIWHYFNHRDKLKILDPMSGGGSTNDVCRFLCHLDTETIDDNPIQKPELMSGFDSPNYDIDFLGFDINPASFNSVQVVTKTILENGAKILVQERIKRNIIEKNAVDDDWNVYDYDLIFMDPPYFNQVGEKYMENAFTTSRESFYHAIRTIVQKSHMALKKGGMIAMIISPQTEKSIDFKSGEVCMDMPYEIMKIMEDEGFKHFNRIQVPLSTEQFGPQDVNRAKEEPYRLLGTARDLILMKKK